MRQDFNRGPKCIRLVIHKLWMFISVHLRGCHDFNLQTDWARYRKLVIDLNFISVSGIIAKLARDWYWWLKFAPFWNHLHETSWHCDSLILSQCQRFIIGSILSETQYQGLLTFCISAFMETLFYFNYRSNIYFSSCRLDLINKWIDNWT